MATADATDTLAGAPATTPTVAAQPSPTAYSDAMTPTVDACASPQPQSPTTVEDASASLERCSPLKPHLELQLDKVGREHQPSLETDGSDDYSSDLGTPLGFHGGSGSFNESAEDFASHRFIGPSVAGDDASARELHTLRCLRIDAKPPRFLSEPVSTESQQRTSASSSASSSSSSRTSQGSRSASSSRSHSATELSTYTVSFPALPALGFTTHVVAMEMMTQSLHEPALVVQVNSVDAESPASVAGVCVGDVVLRVNNEPLEPHALADVLTSGQRTTSPPPLAIVFQRSSSSADSRSDSFEPQPPLPPPPAAKKSSRYSRLSSAVSYGSSLLGSALKRKQKLVHPNSFCDGCGMDPICGALWACSVCPNYTLCAECYAYGTHGLEASDALQELHEAVVQHKLQRRCKRFSDAFLLSLRRDICKGRPDKLEYLGGWIADIVVGTAASRITVRGIEIPSLTPLARQRFVSLLMPLVSNRTDVEVHIEWLPDACWSEARASVDIMEATDAFSGGDHDDDLEKLRIWISDKKTRTTSPFA